MSTLKGNNLKIIDNTYNKGTLLKELLDNLPQDELELCHIIKFLSSHYDFIIDNGNVVVCNKD